MTTKYTYRFRFNKPDFRTSPWSSQINENSDRFDEIMYNVMQANSIASFANGVDVNAGQIVYDADLGSLWINRVTHTTIAVGTFAAERIANPDDWAALQLGLDIKGQWTIDTYYAVNAMAYDATEGLTGICNTEHTSPLTGSMRDEIVKWDIIFDAQSGGGTAATDVSVVPTGAIVSTNVQAALAELDADITATVANDFLVKTATASLSSERVLTDGTNITWDWSVGGIVKAVLAAASVTFAQIASAAVATASEFMTGAANKFITADIAWAAAAFVSVGPLSGAVGLDFNSSSGHVVSANGNVTITPSNLRPGQSFSIYISRSVSSTITLVDQTTGGACDWRMIGGTALPAAGTTPVFISGQRLSTAIVFTAGEVTAI